MKEKLILKFSSWDFWEFGFRFEQRASAGPDSPSRPWPWGGAAARSFTLCFPSITWSGARSRDRPGDRGRLGTRFPGLRRACRSPLISRGKVSSFSFSSSGCRGPEMAASRALSNAPPSPLPPLPPGPSSLWSPDPLQAGAAAAFPCPDFSAAGALSWSAPQESAPGRGTRKPL